MRASVFTPTHRPDHLLETYRSLKQQTVSDFEWIVVPNGPNASVPEEAAFDPRVRVCRFDADGIGALKRYACTECAGDVLVELDHDDLLVPTALERVLDAVQAGAGFVYSDFSNFLPNGQSQIYSGDFGWTTRAEGDCQVMEAFDCNARSLYEIFFAPNHVRAWTREAYERTGGYDSSLKVCDDHDLLCRTYLAGVEMRRVPECLYLYRLREDNSFLEHNALIQKEQLRIGNRYFYRLVEEWARRSRLPKYDLGGRLGCPEGYISVDLRDAELIHDASAGLPFADSSVSVIRAYDFLEHVPPSRVVALMNEIYRVLVPGGWLLSCTPSTDGRGAFQDPTHVSFWNENSFWYYTRREIAQYVPEIRCRFQATRVWTEFPSEWHKENRIPYVYADLCALKGQRQPGVVKI